MNRPSRSSRQVVFGLLVFALAIHAAAPAQEKEPLPKWEHKAVTFGNDEKENIKKLNDLAADGWEYVGPLTPNMVAFKRLRYGLVYELDRPVEVVTGVAFSPDGTHFLYAGPDGKLTLVESGTGHVVRVMDHPHVRNVAFTSDGNKAVSVGSSRDRTVRVWAIDTGKELRRFEGGFDHGLSGVAVSSDGKLLLFGGGIDKTARLLEVESGKQLQRFEGHEEAVHAVALSPDGKRSLTCGYDRTVRMWDNDTGKELRRLDGHADAVWCVVFSPDGKRAYSAGNEPEVIVWDLETGKEVRRMEGNAWAIHALALTRDGRRLACGGWGEGSIRVLDTTTGKEVCRLAGHNDATYDVACSPDGHSLVSGGRGRAVRMWRVPRE